MDPQEEDPCGLKHRIEIAVETIGSRSTVAAILGVGEDIIDSILDIPDYTPSPEDYQTIIENLPIITARQHLRGFTQNWTVYFREKPIWTDGDIAQEEPDYRAQQAAFIVCDPIYPDRVKTEGPFDFGTFTLQQMIEAATDGDNYRLLTIIYYVPSVEYPFNPQL